MTSKEMPVPQTPEIVSEIPRTFFKQAQDILKQQKNVRILGSFYHDETLYDNQDLESWASNRSPLMKRGANIYATINLLDTDLYFAIDSLNVFAEGVFDKLTAEIKSPPKELRLAHAVDQKGGIVYPKISFGPEKLKKITTISNEEIFATDDNTRVSDPKPFEQTIVRGGTNIIILPDQRIYDLFLDYKAQKKIPPEEFRKLSDRITQKRIDAIRKGKPY